MANNEGQQVDTLPIQLYGHDGLLVRKVAVDADGKLIITGGGGTIYFVENGNDLELWWNSTLVHSWTVTPVAPVGRRASLWAMLINN